MLVSRGLVLLSSSYDRPWPTPPTSGNDRNAAGSMGGWLGFEIFLLRHLCFAFAHFRTFLPVCEGGGGGGALSDINPLLPPHCRHVPQVRPPPPPTSTLAPLCGPHVCVGVSLCAHACICDGADESWRSSTAVLLPKWSQFSVSILIFGMWNCGGKNKKTAKEIRQGRHSSRSLLPSRMYLCYYELPHWIGIRMAIPIYIYFDDFSGGYCTDWGTINAVAYSL